MRALTRPLARLATGLALTLSLGTLPCLLSASPAAADHGSVPGDRQIRSYTVRPGDTPSGLAVRFHAWTAELISHNHLGAAGLVAGQRIEIPVVPRAARSGSSRSPGAGMEGSMGGYGNSRVREEIVAASRFYGVDPQLSLAVSWQEAGWRMRHVSDAGAIGAMQVLRPTGRWMEQYAGRELRLRTRRDNVAAGVLMLDVLRGMTRSPRHRIGAYYQGPGGLARHGLYPETRRYVDNVQAIRARLERGLPPV